MARGKLVVPEKFDRFKVDGKHKIWSFSRVSTIDNCYYEYFLYRIMKHKSKDNIYSLCGTLSHDISEKFYTDEIEYNEMAEKFESEFMMIGFSDFKFSPDESKDESMRERYFQNVLHFFKTHQPIKPSTGKVLTEPLIWIIVTDPETKEEHLFMGYIDALHKEMFVTGVDDTTGDEYLEEFVVITDWKTSTKYAGKKIEEHAKQLRLYAEGVHQMFGVPYDKIKVRWNFMKYVDITFPQKNGKKKTTTGERHNWIPKITTNLRMWLKDIGWEQFEIDIAINECLASNSIDSLPQDIQDKYTFADCYVYADVTEEIIDNLHGELSGAIKDIESRRPVPEDWARPPIEMGDSYYCGVLCGVHGHCEYYKAYLEGKEFYINDEYKPSNQIKQSADDALDALLANL